MFSGLSIACRWQQAPLRRPPCDLDDIELRWRSHGGFLQLWAWALRRPCSPRDVVGTMQLGQKGFHLKGSGAAEAAWKTGGDAFAYDIHLQVWFFGVELCWMHGKGTHDSHCFACLLMQTQVSLKAIHGLFFPRRKQDKDDKESYNKNDQIICHRLSVIQFLLIPRPNRGYIFIFLL